MHMPSPASWSFLSWIVGAALASTAAAQCDLQWQPGSLPGTDARVYASVTWDPDGSGPRPPLVVIGGAFRWVGTQAANGIAAWDQASGQWSSLGSGVDGEVRCLATLPNGDLIAGGVFTQAGGAPAAHVARWDGSAWWPLGAGLAGGSSTYAEALAVAANGDLVVGGAFTVAGSTAAASIARWDGAVWSDLGGGIQSRVRALQFLANGDLVAGGTFHTAGNVPANNLAVWDGTSWASLGSGIGGEVMALHVLPNGALVAGGNLWPVGGNTAMKVVVWNGTTWSPLGSAPLPIVAFGRLPNGNLGALGHGTGGRSLDEWTGTTWAPIAAVTASPGPLCGTLLSLPSGDTIVGGEFSGASGMAVRNLARWSGTAWHSMVPGNIPPEVTRLTRLQNGGLFALSGSTFAMAPPQLWNGSSWSPIPFGTGTGVYLFSPQVAVLAQGDIVLSGSTTGLRHWNGTAWSVLAPGLWSQLEAMVGAPDGSLVAAGQFPAVPGLTGRRVARWTGSTWVPLSATLAGSKFTSLAFLPNGDLVVGGAFTSIDGVSANRIARWNGSQWLAIGNGLASSVTSMAVLPSGEIVVAEELAYTRGDNVSRWNGSTWLPYGTGFTVTKLASLPNGEVVAVGATLYGGIRVPKRGDGTSWRTFGGGLNGQVEDAVVMQNGDVLVCGNFTTADNLPSSRIARLAANCPATATAYGATCAGSAGALTFTAEALPWLGATTSSVVAGLAPAGLAIGIVGFAATSTPLSTLHPAAAPGCLVLTTADAITWLPAVGGRARLAFPVPVDPALVGVVLHAQAVQAELDPFGALSLLSSSNGLRLVVGAL